MISWIKALFIYIIIINIINIFMSAELVMKDSYLFLIPFIYSLGVVGFYLMFNKVDTSGTLDDRTLRRDRILKTTVSITVISYMMTPILIPFFIRLWSNNKKNRTWVNVAWDYYKILGFIYVITLAISLFLFDQFDKEMNKIFK